MYEPAPAALNSSIATSNLSAHAELELNEAKAIADREMLAKLKPNLDKAVEEVIKNGNFDLVLERGAVIDVKPQYDITRQVIERMNQMR